MHDIVCELTLRRGAARRRGTLSDVPRAGNGGGSRTAVNVPFGLDLSYVRPDSNTFKALAGTENLVTILFGTNVPKADDWKDIRSIKSLKTAVFSSGLSDEAMTGIGQIGSLASLQVHYSTAVTATGWKELRNLKELRSLSVRFSLAAVVHFGGRCGLAARLRTR